MLRVLVPLFSRMGAAFFVPPQDWKPLKFLGRVSLIHNLGVGLLDPL